MSTKALFGARGSGATVWNVRWTTVDFKVTEERNLNAFTTKKEKKPKQKDKRMKTGFTHYTMCMCVSKHHRTPH